MKHILRRRDVRLLLGGQTLSMYGDWMMFIALGIWARVLTGSNAAAGIVFFFLGLTGLIAPLGGLLVDRMRKRPLMIATHVALACVMCLLLLVHTRGELWLLYLVTVVYGLGGDVFGAARSAMLKAMLPEAQLAEANGLLQSVREGLRIVAPVTGAGLYAAFGGHAVALVDAATFAGSAATLAALPFREPARAPREGRFLPELTAGVRHIARTRALRELTIGVCLALLAVGFCETLVFAVVVEGLHRSAAFVGVLDSFQGIGAIAGGVTAAALMRRLEDVRLAGLGLVLFALATVAWLVPSLATMLPAQVVFGAGIAWAVVALATSYQRRSPLAMQGRVAAAANMFMSVPQTASIALGAFLVTVMDYRVEIGIMSFTTLLAAVYLLTRSESEAFAADPAQA